MSFGRGTDMDVGYGDPEAWGGPMDGVDIIQQIGNVEQKGSARVSKDTYTFLIVLFAIILLWMMGGVVFRKVRF